MITILSMYFCPYLADKKIGSETHCLGPTVSGGDRVQARLVCLTKTRLQLLINDHK